MSKIQLVVLHNETVVKEEVLSAETPKSMQVNAGNRIVLKDATTGESVENLKAMRSGDDLVIFDGDKEILTLTDYYATSDVVLGTTTDTGFVEFGFADIQTGAELSALSNEQYASLVSKMLSADSAVSLGAIEIGGGLATLGALAGLVGSGGGSSGGSAEPVKQNTAGKVAITGEVKEGEVLTATLSDVDGFDATKVTFKWFADGVEIAQPQAKNATTTSSQLTLTQEQVGKTISVKANYTDNLGDVAEVQGSSSSPVENVNDTPVSEDSAVSATEDQTVTGALAPATDVDGDALTYALKDAPANGTVTVNANGSYSYTANANYNGNDSFTYTVDDGNGGVITQTATVTVAAVNDTPVSEDSAVSATEDQTVTGALAPATDVDGDALTYALKDAPANGTVTVNANGSYSYTANANYNGNDSFTYTVDDGNGGVITQTATVTVAAVNDAPTAVDDTAAITIQNGSLTRGLINNLGGDKGYGENQLARADDNAEAVDISSVFASGINIGGTSYSTVYVSTNGTLSFGQSFSAYDYQDYSKLNDISMPIIATYFTDIDISSGDTTLNGESINNIWYDLDAANQTMTITWDNVQHINDYNTTDFLSSFQLQLSADGTGGVDVIARYLDVPWTHSGVAGISSGLGNDYTEFYSSRTADMVNIESLSNSGSSGVIQYNIAADGTISNYDKNQTISIDVLANDSDVDAGDTFTLTSAQVVSGGGSVSVVDGKLEYRTDDTTLASGNTEVVLAYTITDSQGETATANVMVDVSNDFVNTAPTSADVTVKTGGSYTFDAADFKFADFDGNQPTTVNLSAVPSDGTLTLNGAAVAVGDVIAYDQLSQLVYTPSVIDATVADQSISFTVTDNGGTANGGSDTSQSHTLTIDIDPANHAPTSSSVKRDVVEDGTYSFSQSDFTFSDRADGHNFKEIKLDNTSNFTLNGAALTTNTIAVSDIDGLVYTLPENRYGESSVGFGFRVVDDGGTVNGGTDTSSYYNFVFDVASGNNDAAPTIDLQSANTSYTIGSAPTIINGSITADDLDLNNHSQEYKGSSVTVMRDGGANAADVFGATNNLTLDNGNMLLYGDVIGSYTQGDGELSLMFDGANVEKYYVNEAMRSITYQNNDTTTSTTDDVALAWTFNDGDPAGALSATAIQTIDITQVV